MVKYDTFLDTIMQDHILGMPREELEALAINIAYNDFLVNSNRAAHESYQVSCFSPTGNFGPPQELPLSMRLRNKWYKFIKPYIPKEILGRGEEKLFEILHQPFKDDPVYRACDNYINWEESFLVRSIFTILRKIDERAFYESFVKGEVAR